MADLAGRMEQLGLERLRLELFLLPEPRLEFMVVVQPLDDELLIVDVHRGLRG